MGKRGKNPLFRPAGIRPSLPLRPVLISPQIGPPVRRVESYPLADFLYDRARAQNDLYLANLRWQKFKETLTEYERDQVERIERLFAKKVQQLPK